MAWLPPVKHKRKAGKNYFESEDLHISNQVISIGHALPLSTNGLGD